MKKAEEKFKNDIGRLINFVEDDLTSIEDAIEKIYKLSVEYASQGKPENKELESWIGWLQARIPALKDSSNKIWIKQALEGFASQDKWISVETLKSKKSFEALCFADGEYLYGWLYKKDGDFYCESDETLLEFVTHYLLPPPPKTK